MKRRWIPTALVVPAPTRIVADRRPSRARTLQIVWHLCAFVAWRLRARRTPAAIGERVRTHFEHLEGLFAKLSQVLSLRADLFSPAICAELARALGNAPGFSSAVARRLFERETGVTIAAAFGDTFSDTPVAAASIGQVHRARLQGEGTWVAVKIQRPNVATLFQADFRILRRLAWLMGWAVPGFKLHEVIAELQRALTEELDYRYEGQWTKVMRKQLKRYPLVAPKVFARYTTARTLVVQWIDGVRLVDLIAVLTTDRARAIAWCQRNRVKLHTVARRLLVGSFRAAFEDNQFHGDQHPANILVLRRSRVALIDFGTVGSTEMEALERARGFLRGLATGRYLYAAECVLLQCDAVPATRLSAILAEMVTAMQQWAVRTQIAGLTYAQKSLASCGAAVIDIVVKGGCRLTSGAANMRVHRMNLTLDGSIGVLWPTVNILKVAARYFRQAAVRAQRHIGDLVQAGVEEIAEQTRLRGTKLRHQLIPTGE